MQRRYQIESYRRGGNLGHLDIQELAGFARLSQLDQMLPRAVGIHGDAFITGVISPVNRYYLENGLRPVTELLDHGVVVNPLISARSPAYRRVRYALGDAGEIHRFLLPGPGRDVRHVAEGRRELHGQMAVLVGDAAGVFRHAFVQAVVVGEGIDDREGANGLAGHVVRVVLHDDPVVLRLGAHHVRLVSGELSEGHLGGWSAEGLALNIHVFTLHHGLVQELHDFRLDDHVHLDVGGGEAGGVRCGALILARVLAVHVRDGEHTCDRIDAEAIGDRQILLSERLNPGEHWWRLAAGLALDVRVFTFDNIYWTQDLLDRGSYMYLVKNQRRKLSIYRELLENGSQILISQASGL